MQNTWSIGRTWKPREGWSRPVLTDERQHSYSPIRSGTASSSCKRHQTAMSIVWPQDETSTVFASPVRFPGRHTPAKGFLLEPYKRRFAAVMAQVRRPVPFRTRKLRPGTAMVLHSTGCGRVARRRTTRTGSPDTLKVPGLPSYRDTLRVGGVSRVLGPQHLGPHPPGPRAGRATASTTPPPSRCSVISRTSSTQAASSPRTRSSEPGWTRTWSTGTPSEGKNNWRDTPRRNSGTCPS